MPVQQIAVRKPVAVPSAGSKALDALIVRCAQAAEAGNDVEARVYLSGIFEVLAAEQAHGQMPLSA